jgi:phosphoglycolate phosphatase
VAKLLLFDIDGTLVLTGGAGVRAMSRAFEDLFGIADAFRSTHMPGRTDAWILADAAAAHGIPPDALDSFLDAYLVHLAREIELPGPRKGVMPGVRPLLEALSARDDVWLALLTGNYERAARVKLEHFDLWRFFRCGAFGDAAPDRNGLLAKAVERVRASGGPALDPSEIVVIGDTPLDVACAAAGGARSVAVGTGGYSVETLRDAGADAVLPDLSDLEATLDAMELAEAPRSRTEPPRVSREQPVLKTGRTTGPRSLPDRTES